MWVDLFLNNLPQKPVLAVFVEQMDIISIIDLTFSPLLVGSGCALTAPFSWVQ